MSSLCLIMPLVGNATLVNVLLSDGEKAKGSIVPTGQTFTLDAGKQLVLTADPNIGYVIDDWHVNLGREATAVSAVNPNVLTIVGSNRVPLVQIQPTFKLIESTLTFDPAQGVLSKDEMSMTIVYGSKLAGLPKPTRVGYTFKGWFVNNQEWREGQTVSALVDLTAIARWEANNYQLRIETTTGIKGIYYTFGDQTTRYNTGSVSEAIPYGTKYSWYAVTEDGYETEYTLEHQMTGTMEAEPKTFVLKAEPKTFTIYFDAGAGTCDTKFKQVTYNETYGDLPTAISTGFVFAGWETANRDRISSTTVVKLTSDTTLSARWTAETILVKGEAENGHITIYPGTVEFGKSVEIKWIPNSESGYDYSFVATKVYAGADTNGVCLATYTEGTGVLFTPSSYYKEIYVQACYAKTPKTYTVTFDGNNGTPSAEEMTVRYEEPYGTLPTATRVGYDFDGWSTSRSGPSRVVATNLYTRTYDSDLYARWRAKTYAVSVETTCCSMSVTTNGLSATRGTYDLPLFISVTPDSRTGYQTRLESVMVYSSDSPSAAPLKSISSPESFYMSGLNAYYDGIVIRAIASQAPLKYRVSFDLNGGTGLADAMDVTYDAKYGKLPVVTRVGYDFVAWRLEDGTEITEDTVVQITTNSRLTAEWQAKTFTVSFDAMTPDVNAPPDLTVTYDSTYGTLPNLTRTGFAFDGWYDDNQTLITAEKPVKITSNQTLVAHWTVNLYTIVFNANGGTGLMTSVDDCAYDELVNLPPCGFKHPTLTFIGWATDPLAETAELADGATVQGLTVETETTLYAIWQDLRNELTKAAHCVNCTVEGTGNIPFVPWSDPESGETAAKSGYMDLTAPESASPEDYNSWLRLNLVGPGTFSFKWRVGEGNPLDRIVLSMNKGETEYYGNEWANTFTVVEEEGWCRVTCELPEARPYAVSFESFARAEENHGYILLDELIWTPASENPVPTEADRPVIGASFTFMTDARFDYVVWTTETLENGGVWTEGEPIPGDGKTMKLPGWLGVAAGGDALRYGDVPQRFYKVEVRQRK